MPEHLTVHEELKRAIREKYSSIPQNESEMIVDAVRMFATELVETDDTDLVIQNAGELIFSLFGFKEVLIGLREENGLFTYKEILGHSKRAEEAIVEAEYKIEEMSCSEDFPCTRVSNICEMCLKEDLPDDEREARQFNLPADLEKERISLEDMMEGDYLDVFIYGKDDEMLGWIEVSYPSNGKFPSRETVRGLELLSSILGIALSRMSLSK